MALAERVGSRGLLKLDALTGPARTNDGERMRWARTNKVSRTYSVVEMRMREIRWWGRVLPMIALAVA